VCNTTIYILSKGPHRDLKENTLKDAFNGEKPKVSHFHVFGSAIYIHVLDEKRTKLEHSSIKGICVGYNETSEAYWIYIRVQGKTYVSKYIKFDEDVWPLRSHVSSLMIE
jgi:hypothetical protein